MIMAGSERIKPFPRPGVNPSASLLVKFPPSALALREHDRAPLPLVWKPGEPQAAQSTNLDEIYQISWGNLPQPPLSKLLNSLLEIHRPPMLFLIDRPNAMLSGCRT
jgi:hypothetical protein